MDLKRDADQNTVLQVLVNYFGKTYLRLPIYHQVLKPYNKYDIAGFIYKTIGETARDRFIQMNLKNRGIIIDFKNITYDDWIM
jgi:hypothetical protein